LILLLLLVVPEPVVATPHPVEMHGGEDSVAIAALVQGQRIIFLPSDGSIIGHTYS
jgi:hypothetical protein